MLVGKLVVRSLACLLISCCIVGSPAKACFNLASVPIPVGFETASAELTDMGKQAAKELLQTLLEKPVDEVTLIGHADARGGDEYNMRLSDRRAQAVADFLKRGGITAKIITVAKGKSEPLEITDATQFTREDIWALNRRVAWKHEGSLRSSTSCR